MTQSQHLISQHEAAIVQQSTNLTTARKHLESMQAVQLANRNVYLALAKHYEDQGALEVANSYDRLVTAMAGRDEMERSTVEQQCEVMERNIEGLREKLMELKRYELIVPIGGGERGIVRG